MVNEQRPLLQPTLQYLLTTKFVESWKYKDLTLIVVTFESKGNAPLKRSYDWHVFGTLLDPLLQAALAGGDEPHLSTTPTTSCPCTISPISLFSREPSLQSLMISSFMANCW